MSSSQTGEVGQRAAQTNRYLWVVLPLTIGGTMALALTQQGIPVLYPFIQSELGLSRAQIGLITSSIFVGYGAAIGLSGWLTDYSGVKRIAIVSLLGMGALTVAILLVHSWSVLLVLMALSGIISAPISPACTLAIIEWFPYRVRALAMSLKQSGASIGGAIGAATFPAVAAVIGWRMTAALAGVIILAVGVAFIVLYRDAPVSRETHKLDFTLFWTILRDRRLLTAIIWGATVIGIQFTTLSYFMLFLVERLQFSPITAGGLLALAQVCGGVSRPLWGVVSDFVFHGRRITALAATGFLTVTWLAGISLIGPGAPNFVLPLLAIAIGMSTLSFHGVLLTLVAELSDQKQIGTTAGVAGTIYQVTTILAPPLFGYLVDISHSYSLAWRVYGAWALAATLALLILGREPQRR